MGNECKNGIQENHEHNKVKPNYKIELSTQGGHFLKRVEFLLVLWTLLVQFTNKWEANTALKQSNNLKTAYTPSAAIMVDCISCGTKEQGVPMRRHGIVCTVSQSEGSIQGHITYMWAFCKVM